MAVEGRAKAMVFGPTPLLTVTIEGAVHDDIHVHAGGQGVWVARMLANLDIEACLCGPAGGETGRLVQALVSAEGFTFRPVPVSGGNGAYVHHRRGDDREILAAMPPAVLTRHEIDELYSAALGQALNAEVNVLCGPSDPRTLPADTYRRLAADLQTLGSPVVADLSGDALEAALRGGLTVLKVSHLELIESGRAAANTSLSLLGAMEVLVDDGARHVVVSRAEEPTLALVDHQPIEVKGPVLQRVEHRGAGDSMTAGIAAGLAQGLDVRSALRLGYAAGALNVTRHGHATGQRDAITKLAERVKIRPLTREGS
jgi:1-phosphofructokinase